MTQAAGRDDYSLAVRVLQVHIKDLNNICEERLGLQDKADSDPNYLRNLLDLISQTLGDISTQSPITALAAAARKRQLKFDTVADLVFQQMNHHYRDPDKSFEAWAKNRRKLRKELDILHTWTSELHIVYSIAFVFLGNACFHSVTKLSEGITHKNVG
jgi:hypothetical protein